MKYPMVVAGPIALSLVLFLSLMVLSWTTVSAEMLSTEQALTGLSADSAQDRLASLLQREDVQEQFVAWGVSPGEAQSRVAGLSGAEVRQLNASMESMPAGQLDVVTVAVIVAAVLFVTDLMHLTDVYSFVN
jgi:hypothetical protein